MVLNYAYMKYRVVQNMVSTVNKDLLNFINIFCLGRLMMVGYNDYLVRIWDTLKVIFIFMFR